MKVQKESNSNRADIQERKIAVPPEVIFSAISDPEMMTRWWGPKGFSSTIDDFDFKVGGECRLTMHGPDGKDYPNLYHFIEIKKNQKVVIEHFSKPHHFILTIRLTSNDDRSTTVNWHQEFDTVEHYQEIADFVAVANQQNLERLAFVVKG